MEFRNKKTWRGNPLEGYLVAFVAFALAFLLRRQLHNYLDDALPTFFFTIATILVAARYGFWPAMLTLALSLPTSVFFFLKPYDEFAVPTLKDLLVVLYFTSVTILVAVLMEKSHRTQYNSELNARVSDSRYRLLVKMDQDMRTSGGGE